MKKSFANIVILSVIVMSSCQKEIDWGTISGGGTVNQLLVKIISKTGTDSTVVTYSYDAQKRLIRETTTGVSGGTVVDNELKINRNTAGIILNSIQKSPALVSAGIDSVVTIYYYNAAASVYTASSFKLDIAGFAVTDSAVYTYDVNGRITSDVHFLKTGILPPLQVLKNQYSYSANGMNLIGMDQSASTTPGGPLTPISSQIYTFDTKNNPLIIKNEAVLLTRTGLYNANNASKFVFNNTAQPTANFTMDYVIKYNSFNKPDSSYGTRSPGGTITASKYIYQ